MLQIVAVMINSVTRTKVTLLPVGSLGIQLGHSKQLQSLSCKMGGQIELCTRVCIIVTVLHQVHPGEDRGARRKIFTSRTHHIYIKLHQSAPISLYLRD